MLPRCTFTFPDAHTKHLFLQWLAAQKRIEIETNSIQGSIENSDSLMVGYVEESVLENNE